MKFKELQIGDKFTTSRHENLVFQKIQLVKGNCCTPKHNAIGVGHGAKILFADNEEVEKIETQ